MAVHVMSRMRFSLTFRIAMHYCVQLLRTVFRNALILTLVLGVFSAYRIEEDVSRVSRGIPNANGVYDQNTIQNDRIRAYWSEMTLPADNAERFIRRCKGLFSELPELRITVYAQCDPAIREEKDVILRIGAWDEEGRPEAVLSVADRKVDGESGAVSEAEIERYRSGTVVAVVDLTDAFVLWLVVMAALVACDLLRMVYFVRHHHLLNKSVFAPIRDITELAATLSGNNLSNRINIAGTKNELKDLAVVINTMLDRIERSYNSQKQFVSDASHELRTPIAVMQGYVNMLKRWGKDDKTVLDEGLNAIAQETESMKDLVENLLFLARHDKKTLMMEMEKFDPCDVMMELQKEAAMVTPEDEFLLEPQEHCSIEADRGMVKQVMRILLDNAVKYTPKGGTITMGVTQTEDGCMLTMKDNGPGIPGEELPKIFDRFYRSDKARKAESGGHGLGLSIARIIVMAHGGKIRVRSKVGEGTVFSVMLPATQTSAEESKEPETDGKKVRRVIPPRKKTKNDQKTA